MSATAETHAFQTEIRKLLDILVHSLYTDREIFLRELISNASDALHRLQFEMLTNHALRDAGAELAIHIYGDPAARTLTIADTGIGMTREELIDHLGTIARSGAEAFMRSLEAGQSAEQIGRFGVGFYSLFMVAAEVHVTSLSYRPEATAWTWISAGEDSYRLEPGEATVRGTTITIHLKEDAAEFAERSRLIDIVHRHSDFVSFPIYVHDTVVNRQAALWRQSPSTVSDEAAHEFYKQLTYDIADPLLRVQVNTDAPVQIRALLFIPATLDRGLLGLRQDFGLRLYSHKVRIQDHNKDLLPNYLRFVEGVVDSDDLDLNVSRERVQASPILSRIKRVLSHRLLDALRDLAKKDEEAYARFWVAFGAFIKEGVVSELGDRERLLPLLRFHTSRSPGHLRSLAAYIGDVALDQKRIYYLIGEDLESVARSPHLDYFRRQNLEVLYLVDPLDGLLPSALGEYEGFALQNVDDAGLDLPAPSAADAEEAPPPDLAPLIARMQAQLGERVAGVQAARLLVDSPARLVTPAGAWGSEMARVRRLFEQDFTAPKKILEINPRHPLIQNLHALLAAGQREEVVSAAIEQLHANALLLEGLHPHPAAMVAQIETLMQAATREG